jgi:hypothetical protein
MLELRGPGKVHTCDGLTRRDFLQVGSLGAVGLGMAEWAALQASGAVDGNKDVNGIMIFNLGAPSQLDTWDMKPNAPAEIRGPFQAIETKAPGITVSELFPGMARHGDKISYVRSVYHTAAAVHDTGHQMMQTGRLFSGGLESPHAGCVLGYLKGRKTDLPAHVVLPEKMGPTGGNLPHGQEAGFLGKQHDPFVLNADPSAKDFRVPDLLPPTDLPAVRTDRRRKLRELVDTAVKEFEASPQAKLMDASFEQAYQLMTSATAREAFALEQEPDALRDKYGRNRFGQYYRTRATPVQPGTPAQLNQRARMTTNAAAWRALTDAQRAGWLSLGAMISRTDALGQVYTLNGFMAYCNVNNNLLSAGDAAVSDAPAIVTPGDLLTVTVTLTSAAFSIAYTATPLAAGTRLFLFVSPQQSAGRKFNGDYRLLSVTTAAAASPINAMSAYTAKFGVPVTGNRIFISLTTQKAGFKGSPFNVAQVVA